MQNLLESTVAMITVLVSQGFESCSSLESLFSFLSSLQGSLRTNLIIEGLKASLTQMTFQVAFCCFSSDSLEFLHVALNSFRKCCSNHVFSAAITVLSLQ